MLCIKPQENYDNQESRCASQVAIKKSFVIDVREYVTSQRKMNDNDEKKSNVYTTK